MARTYAGILALLAMLVMLLRALKDGAGFDGTITSSLVGMAVMGLVGMVVGAIAQQTVDESVRTILENELAAHTETPDQQTPVTT